MSAERIRTHLKKLGAPQAAVSLPAVQAMKPQARERPFSRPGWLFELKYDGFRMLAAGGRGEVSLSYKSGVDSTPLFPEIARAVAALPFRSLVLDGEVVILDSGGRPDFQRLQRRGLRTRSADAERAAIDSPAVLVLFDLLGFEDFDLRPLPLHERKDLLRQVLPADGPLRFLDHVAERGEDLYAAVEALGLEGIVAKRADSPYRPGYSADWLKVRIDRSSDFAVVGFDPVPGARSGFRNLHLAVREGTGWVYTGTVGSGFSREDFAEIRGRLEPLRRPRPPLAVPAGRGTVWVEPELVVEVRYKEWTAAGNLRHPVYLRWRDDKLAADCRRPGEDSGPAASGPAVPGFTNVNKVFWPGEGFTKGDLLTYYQAVAPWMLPYLDGRPLLVDRYPNGIDGKSFYQRSSPETAVEDAGSLLHLVNLGAIPFHVEASRTATPDRPDWCILDLDPKTAPFAHVVKIACAVHALCSEIELPSFVKTSGGSGLHILLPLGGQLDHQQTRQLAELLAEVTARFLPDIATTARSIAARGGRVYIDALQNGRGKVLAAPYAARPVPGASVSTPLDWQEVGPGLDVREFNLQTVPERVKKRKRDPLSSVLTESPDLARSLELLAERF